MNLDIRGNNLELTPAIKEYIETKIFSLSKILEKWEKLGAVNAKFELDRTTHHHNKGLSVYFAEINIVVDGKKLHAKQSGEDPHEVIDKVKDIIKNEISKLKGKEKIVKRKNRAA